MDRITRLFRYRILPIYWAFLSYMLLRPGTERPLDYWFLFSGIDKLVHLLIFIVLGYTFNAAFPRIKIFNFLMLMFIYSALTEILQGLMNAGRSMEGYDLFADIAGVAAGYYLYQKIKV